MGILDNSKIQSVPPRLLKEIIFACHSISNDSEELSRLGPNIMDLQEDPPSPVAPWDNLWHL